MRIHIPKIHKTAALRPAGYAKEVLASGVVQGEWLELTPETYSALCKKYGQARSLAQAGKCLPATKTSQPILNNAPKVKPASTNTYYAQVPNFGPCLPCAQRQAHN